MPVEYAEVIDGLTGQWMAVGPTTGGGQVSPYQTGAGGGFVVPSNPVQSPPIGAPTRVLDLAYEAETYTTPTGARAWKPTAADEALIDYVTQNPYAGVDELLEAQGDAAVKAAGRGFANMPYVGDVVGGAVEGAAVYGRTGSLTHGLLAGGGATAGGIVGTAIGAGLGGFAGPVGVFAGGLIGGAVGSALGSALGQGLANLIDPLPNANLNGATVDGDLPFTGGQCEGTLYLITWQYSYGDGWFNNSNDRYGPLRKGSEPIPPGASEGCPEGTSYKDHTMYSSGTPLGLASGCGAKVRNINVSPLFGMPDNCGNPAPELENYDPTGDPTKTRPANDPIELPGPQPDPNPQPGPKPSPTTGPIPGPQPDPITVPDPIGGPVPTGEPVPGNDDKKEPYPKPSPDPNPDPPNPNPTEQPGPGGEQCDPCVELAAIRAKLDETFSLAWELPACETSFSISRTGEKSGQGLAGLSQKIDALYQALRVVHDNTRCDNDSFVVVPDSWPMKVEAGRPQLVLIYASKNSDKTWGSRRYEFCIPHFDNKLRKALKTLVPKEIKKGSSQGTYTLKDNSKIITYCRTNTEAKRILNAFDKLILKEMKTDNKKTGEISPSTKFLEITLYPFEARYFSQGQQNPNPDWKDKLY